MTGKTLELGGSPGSYNDFVERQRTAEPDREFTHTQLVELYTGALADLRRELLAGGDVFRTPVGQESIHLIDVKGEE